ncbi:unnamed protein product, partial [Staurois parvus]
MIPYCPGSPGVVSPPLLQSCHCTHQCCLSVPPISAHQCCLSV